MSLVTIAAMRSVIMNKWIIYGNMTINVDCISCMITRDKSIDLFEKGTEEHWSLKFRGKGTTRHAVLAIRSFLRTTDNTTLMLTPEEGYPYEW